jgi:hypothetical protein
MNKVVFLLASGLATLATASVLWVVLPSSTQAAKPTTVTIQIKIGGKTFYLEGTPEGPRNYSVHQKNVPGVEGFKPVRLVPIHRPKPLAPPVPETPWTQWQVG